MCRRVSLRVLVRGGARGDGSRGRRRPDGRMEAGEAADITRMGWAEKYAEGLRANRRLGAAVKSEV